MKKVTKLLCLALSIAMMLSCFAACGSNYTADNTEFVIGVSGPLTGPAANYGIAVKNSAQMAVDEINAAGGLDGVKFKFVMKDDKHDAANVAGNYATLLEEEGMQVSLGTVTTAPGLEFSKLSKEDNVFFLTPSASGDDIPAADNGFQMCFADGNQGTVAADFVNNNVKEKKIGIFYKSDDPYSKGIYDKFKATIDSKFEVVEAPFTGDGTNFETQISTLKDCKFLFMPIYYDPATVFMTQAKGKIANDAIYYGCDGFDGIATKEGFDINAIPQEVSMLSHFDSNAKTGAAAEFVKKYVEKYGKTTLNQFGASAYDCVYAIYNAMKKAKDAGKEIDVTINASDLCEILKAEFTGDFTYSGVTGTDITWKDNGYVDKAAKKFEIKAASK